LKRKRKRKENGSEKYVDWEEVGHDDR